MPSAAPANDVRVRTPVSLAGQLHQSGGTGPSKQPSTPASRTTAATAQRQRTSSNTASTSRPALYRNVASHTSIGSGGTDSSAYLQSDDGSGGVPDFGDTIDSTTFEQVCQASICGSASRVMVVVWLMRESRSSKWTTTKTSASSANPSFTISSTKPAVPFRRWTRACKYSPIHLPFSPPTTSAPAPVRRETFLTNTSSSTSSESRDLNQLSQLGHFLKGSSATLGLTKVKDSCEKIQHFGAKKDETGTNDVDDDDECLKSLKEEIKITKKEFVVVEKQLKKFYRDEGES